MKRAVLLLPLLLAGCLKYPEPYRPPVQRKPLEINGDHALTHFFFMNAPDAEDHFLSGILPELHDGAWRWVMKKATFQFGLFTTNALRLKADLAVPDFILKQTGPVKISVSVEGHPLDTSEFSTAGSQVFEKPVPAEWLTTTRPVQVSLEADKLWTSPADGSQRGFIVTSIGFVQ